MYRNNQETLGQILTLEQLIMVERMLSCSRTQRVQALKEYYRRPPIAESIRGAGWDPETLAYMTALNSGKLNK